MIFDADGSSIENKATGERIALKRKDGTFMMEMKVGPEDDEDDAMGTNPAGSVRHHSIGTGADCNRKTDDALAVCAGAVEPDDADVEIEMEAGMRRPERKAASEEPTAQERAEHMFTHMPFRSWCRHCVRGRGKEEPCRQGRGDPEHPKVHMDYMFMGEETGGKTLAILVAKDLSSRALMSTVVPRKTTGEFVSKHVVVFMKELVCEMSVVTLKTDNEPALVAGSPDDPGNGEDAQERHRGEVDGEARPRERAVDVAGGVCGMAGEPRGGGPRTAQSTRARSETTTSTRSGDG